MKLKFHGLSTRAQFVGFAFRKFTEKYFFCIFILNAKGDSEVQGPQT